MPPPGTNLQLRQARKSRLPPARMESRRGAATAFDIRVGNLDNGSKWRTARDQSESRGLLTNSAASFRKKKRSANSQHARSAATPVQVYALIDDALRMMTLRARACTESLLNWSAAPPSMPRGAASSEPSLHGAAWRCPALGASHAQSYDAGTLPMLPDEIECDEPPQKQSQPGNRLQPSSRSASPVSKISDRSTPSPLSSHLRLATLTPSEPTTPASTGLRTPPVAQHSATRWKHTVYSAGARKYADAAPYRKWPFEPPSGALCTRSLLRVSWM